MPSQGPNNGSSFTNVGAGNSWSNPGYAQYSDANRATVTLAGGSVSTYLRATGFGFSIPAGSTVNGIIVEIQRLAVGNYAGGGGESDYYPSCIVDTDVYIVKANSAAGSNKARSGCWPDQAEFYATYGGSNDLWGTTWTPEDINSSGFGVQIAVGNARAHYSAAYINHIRITVHYTSPPSTTHAVSSQII